MNKVTAIKNAIKKTYGRKGEEVVQKNFEAVDTTLANLFEVTARGVATGKPIYYDKAKRALVETYKRRSPIGLVGTRINVEMDADLSHDPAAIPEP